MVRSARMAAMTGRTAPQKAALRCGLRRRQLCGVVSTGRGERQLVIDLVPLCYYLERDFGPNMSHRVRVRGRLLRAPSSYDVRGDGPGLP